jgi:hypothetical protein
MSDYMTAELMTSVDQWLEQLDQNPVATEATVKDSAATAAKLVGSDVEKIRREANALKAAKGTPTAREVFKASPGNGCTSVLNIARMAAGFDPLDKDSATAEKFLEYAKKVEKAPFFHLRKAQTEKVERHSKDWSALIDTIGNLYEGVTEEERGKIVQSIKDLAKAAANKESMHIERALFAQNVVVAKKGSINVQIYYTTLNFKKEMKKGSTTEDQKYTVTTVNLEFRVDLWPTVSDKIYDRTITDVDDWMDETNTKADGVGVAVCV